MIYKNNYEINPSIGDIEIGTIYKGDVLLYQRGKHLLTSVFPLIFSSNGMDLLRYHIVGNYEQLNTPTLSSEVEVYGVGNKTNNMFNYKNIINDSKVNPDNGSIIGSTTSKVSNYIPVESGKRYYISSTGQLNVYMYDENKSYVGSYLRSERKVIPSNVKFIMFDISNSMEDDEGNIYIMMCEGEQKTFEPYGYYINVLTDNEDGTDEQTTQILVDEPLGINQTIYYPKMERINKYGCYILTGDEDWQEKRTLVRTEYFTRMPNHEFRDRQNTAIYSNYFEQIPTISFTVNNYMRLDGTDNWNGNVMFFSDTITSLSNWVDIVKEKYNSGHPIKIYYPLEEPTTENILLPSIPTIQPKTVIDFDNIVKPSEMYIYYKASTKTYYYIKVGNGDRIATGDGNYIAVRGN